MLDEVLQDIAGHRQRSWHRWVGRNERGITHAVRDELEAGRWITVERRRILPDKVELRERHKVKQYTDTVKAALHEPVARVDPRVAAALALAANGEVKALLSRQERREHKERLAELGDRIGPVADALKKALQSKRASAAGAGVAASAGSARTRRRFREQASAAGADGRR
jgi:hypothetical protein